MPRKNLAVHVVVAVVALAVAGIATAGAAKLLTGKDIKNGSIELVDLSKKARASLAGQGSTGATGATGAGGAAGQNGANGKDATGLTMGTVIVASANTFFVGLGGNGGSGTGAAPESATGITPNRALTISEMAVSSSGLAGAETAAVTVMVNGSASSLACTITAATPTCVMPGTLSLPARTPVGMRVVTTNIAVVRGISWSWTFS
jgi:hypothetical protein